MLGEEKESHKNRIEEKSKLERLLEDILSNQRKQAESLHNLFILLARQQSFIENINNQVMQGETQIIPILNKQVRLLHNVIEKVEELIHRDSIHLSFNLGERKGTKMITLEPQKGFADTSLVFRAFIGKKEQEVNE